MKARCDATMGKLCSPRLERKGADFPLGREGTYDGRAAVQSALRCIVDRSRLRIMTGRSVVVDLGVCGPRVEGGGPSRSKELAGDITVWMEVWAHARAKRSQLWLERD